MVPKIAKKPQKTGLSSTRSNVIRTTPISRWNIKVEALEVELPHELEIEQ